VPASYHALRSPELSVFGYVKFAFTWDDGGMIQLSWTVSGLPAVQYQGRISTSNWQQFVPDLLLLLTTIIYVPLTINDIVQQLRAEHRLRERRAKETPEQRAQRLTSMRSSMMGRISSMGRMGTMGRAVTMGRMSTMGRSQSMFSAGIDPRKKETINKFSSTRKHKTRFWSVGAVMPATGMRAGNAHWSLLEAA